MNQSTVDYLSESEIQSELSAIDFLDIRADGLSFHDRLYRRILEEKLSEFRCVELSGSVSRRKVSNSGFRSPAMNEYTSIDDLNSLFVKETGFARFSDRKQGRMGWSR